MNAETRGSIATGQRLGTAGPDVFGGVRRGARRVGRGVLPQRAPAAGSRIPHAFRPRRTRLPVAAPTSFGPGAGSYTPPRSDPRVSACIRGSPSRYPRSPRYSWQCIGRSHKLPRSPSQLVCILGRSQSIHRSLRHYQRPSAAARTARTPFLRRMAVRHTSPTAASRLGIVSRVKRPGSRSVVSSVHSRGAETVAMGRARTQ